MLRDRDLIDAQGRLRSSEVPLPHGIQALIAARLDTLPPDHKALLADAAVIGRVFWTGAAGALGQRDLVEVIGVLHELMGKEFVRPHRDSSLAGQAEFEFSHGLVREVAYGALPRSERAAKHLAATRWLEGLVGDRVADVAEILAEHTSQALDLAHATGDTALAEEVTASAQRYAVLAARKALSLDSARALALLDRALTLTDPESPDHPDVLVQWAEAASQVGRLRDAATAFQQAADRYKQRDDAMSAGGALRQASTQLANLGDPNAAEVLDQALRLLGARSLRPHWSRHSCPWQSTSLMPERLNTAFRSVERAEPLLTEPDADLMSVYYMVRGLARSRLGDAKGSEDLELSIQLAIDADLAHAAAVSYYNLATISQMTKGPEETLRTLDPAESFCQTRGLSAAALWLRTIRVGCLVEVGRLRDCVTLADTLLPVFSQDGDDLSLAEVGVVKVQALIEIKGCSGHLAQEVLSAARRTEMPPMVASAQTVAAMDCWTAGRSAEAEALLEGAPQHRHSPDRSMGWHRPPGCAMRSRYRKVGARACVRGSGRGVTECHTGGPAQPADRSSRAGTSRRRPPKRSEAVYRSGRWLVQIRCPSGAGPRDAWPSGQPTSRRSSG